MDNPGADIPQAFYCKRVGLCRDTLRPFVLVLSVYVFETDGMSGGQCLYFDAFFPYILTAALSASARAVTSKKPFGSRRLMACAK